jgi:aryl-alcohol dehydrogenase-like predicted oxidoreductase
VKAPSKNQIWDRLPARTKSSFGPLPVTTAGGQPQSALILGTAQLGLDYGAANTGGMPDSITARELIAEAVASGVTHFDTARAYGIAEDRIGQYLDEDQRSKVRIVTKLRPLDHLAEDASPAEVRAATDASLLESLGALGGRIVDAFLLHRAFDRTRCGGAAWQRLQEHWTVGLVGRLGVSVGNPQEALDALADPVVRYIQLPFNLLDTRWSEVAEAAVKRTDVTLVARSALLQGLLGGAVPAERWPVNAGVDVPLLMKTLGELVHELGRDDLVDLCLAFVRAQPWLHATVVGTETAEQVRDLCRRFHTPALTADETAYVRSVLPVAPTELLDPSRWRFA